MTRILVVDDDAGLARALAINLQAHGYEVDTAGDGATALSAAAARRPDLVVLDLGLPDLDGVDVVRGLRGWSTAPVLVLSARHEQAEKVAALDAGADDYVTKPFGMDELLARVRAALRRAAPGDAEQAVVETAAFTVDLAAHRVHSAAGRCGSPQPSGTCWRSWCATPGGWSPSASCCRRCGDRGTAPRPITCGSTCRNCAASWSRTRPGPGTS